VSRLELDHTLRWHEKIRAVVALMSDPLSGNPLGIHRTFLRPDGTKLERKMLGRQGVVRLSPDSEVTMGLGITEGVEDGLAVLLSGWAPVWAATSAGAITNFPVLSGIGLSGLAGPHFSSDGGGQCQCLKKTIQKTGTRPFGDDDGLAARPLYAWPDPVAPCRPKNGVD